MINRPWTGPLSVYRSPEALAAATDRLAVGSSLEHDWRRRCDDLPAPILRLTMGFIWSWAEVRRWAASAGRRAEPVYIVGS